MKKIYIFLIISLLMFMLASCTKPDKPGFTLGFNKIYGYEVAYVGLSTNIDTHTKGQESLKLYYGIDEPLYQLFKSGGYGTLHQEYVPVAVIYLIYNKVDAYPYDSSIEYDDYHDIDNTFILKEISKEELLTRNYMLEFNGNKIKYNCSEDINIPSKIFKNDKGRFYIDSVLVQYSFKTNKFKLGRKDNQIIYYDVRNTKTTILKEG